MLTQHLLHPLSSRLSEYTDMKINVGRYNRFGRFKVISSTSVRLSILMKLTKPQWFTLYRQRGQKSKCGSIKLSFEFPTPSSPLTTTTKSTKAKATPLNASDNSICSDYLLRLVSDLRSQVAERDQRIRTMQEYIDRILTRILYDSPHLLENT